jgi:hypothetical protein
MTTARWFLFACLVLAGCPQDDDDTAGDDDISGDDDTAGDDDSTGDDDGNALYGYLGEALVHTGDSYDGHEDLYYIADSGAGADVCRVRVDLISTAPRDDCADCEWAFAVTAFDPRVMAESSVGCAGVGVDGDVMVGLTGERGYGFAREYFGHTDVLMIDQGGIWTAVNFAVWSEATGELSYDWEVGYQGY